MQKCIQPSDIFESI